MIRPNRVEDETPVFDWRQHLSEHLWLYFFAVNLAGYSLCCKGWAYLGAAPLFIGEVLMLSGLLIVLLSGRWIVLFQSWLIWPIVAFAGWGLFRTLPYIGLYKMFALRDAMIWGYSAFTIITYIYITTKPERLRLLADWYAKWIPYFLILLPIIWIPTHLAEGADTQNMIKGLFVGAKAGDTGVHLGGVLAYWASGLIAPPSFRLLMMLGGTFLWVATTNRGGMVSCVLAAMCCTLFRPLNITIWRVAFTGTVILFCLMAIDFRVEIPGRDREIAVSQVTENIASIVVKSKKGDLDGTKEWRLKWWKEIVKYTFFGKHFWMGKGFGINLATDDGFHVNEDKALRSPHNGHLSVLARAGVPGFGLWVLLHLGWGASMMLHFWDSTQRGERRWASWFLFLTCYWLAFIANTTFDVFIEGPMGGIWLWSLLGIGLASMWIYRRYPEVMENDKVAV